MSVEILTTLEECAAIHEEWNEIALLNSTGPMDLGVTNSFELTTTLWNTHLERKPQHILVARNNGRIAGIFPCYIRETKSLGVRKRELSLIPELYPGRSGFLLRDPSETSLLTLMKAVYGEIPDWDVLTLSTVDGSRSSELLNHVCAKEHYGCIPTDVIAVPYIELPSAWDEYLQTVGRHFRQDIRRRRRRLEAEHTIEVKTYTAEDQTQEFLDAMFAIEERSWKQISGSSLTRNPKQEEFHREFTPVCARAGWLQCFILYLDGEAVAHNYLVVYGGISYAFKSSYCDVYKALAPGKVLRSMVLEQLIDKGVKYLDIVGEVQPHKMDWTDKTYRSRRYAIFNRTARGKAQHARIWAAQALRARSHG